MMKLSQGMLLGILILSGGLGLTARASAGGADCIVVYTNRVRAAYGLPALRVNARLSAAALYHARNMAYQYRMSWTVTIRAIACTRSAIAGRRIARMLRTTTAIAIRPIRRW